MNKTVALNEVDIQEDFSRSSGPGGQNVNKVSTKVTLRHRPTNISVTVQDSRSQAANRELARERLLAAIQRAEQERENAARQEREKKRRQNAKRPRALKERILHAKKRRSQIKQARKTRDME